MKSFYTIFIIFIIVTTNLYPQIEFRDKSISYPIFLGEQFMLEDPQRNIDPETLDSIIISTMEASHIPGLAALIVKHDEIVWSRNYGYANIELNRPVEDSTLFLIASISKTIMVTAIMQLWEDGLFNLDDNINDYLQPDFQVINPWYPSDSITFKMLMTHTSSITDNWSIQSPLIICGDSPISLDSFLVNFFTPGGIYYDSTNFNNYSPYENNVHYTSAGSCILAYIVEKLSGMPFDQYCRENIFNPLDMDETSWFLEGLDTNNIATPYEWLGGQYVATCHQGWPLYPITQLRINKLEFEHFMSTYMNWGTYNGIKILDSTTVDKILTVYTYENSFRSWGLIWAQILLNQRYLWGHGGNIPGAAAGMFYHPEENWGIITFYNKYPGDEYLEIIGAISEYAYLYGEIYAINTKINNHYMSPNNDTLAITTKFSNVNQHNFTANAIYISSDSSYIDSTALYDDGLHGDTLAGDGLWGGFIHSVLEEDILNVGISTLDSETGDYFYTRDLTRFTTIGPVIVEDYVITSNDTVPNPDDQIRFKLALRNNGLTETATNIEAIISTTDSCISEISGNSTIFGDIPAGESVIPASGFQQYTVEINPNSPGDKDVLFNVDIYSNDNYFWSDSFAFHIYVTAIADEKNSLPDKYSLRQNYPNPFNPITTISYSLPLKSQVDLVVYNTLGEKVKQLVNEEKEAGTHRLELNATDLPSGIYFYRLQAGSYIETKKMVLLR